nr:DUF2125 domain-containing protein [Acetobacter farinalis]
MEGVQVVCGVSAGPVGFSYGVPHVTLELALWHPLTMLARLEGPQGLALSGGGIKGAGRLVLRTEGAASVLALPLRRVQAGRLAFHSAFLRLVPLEGAAQAHPVTLRDVAGTLVWNRQADAQASAVGLSFTAGAAVVAPWAERVEAVRGAVSLPGPMARLSALWPQAESGRREETQNPVQNEPRTHAQDDGQNQEAGDSQGHGQGLAGISGGEAEGHPAAPAEYAEILVQHLAGRWRGLGFSWSGRLVKAPGSAALGETWLTLNDWRAFLARLQQDKTLTPAQTELLAKLTDQLEQRTGGMDAPLSVPVQVRQGAAQLGGVPILSLLATLHGVAAQGQALSGTPRAALPLPDVGAH